MSRLHGESLEGPIRPPASKTEITGLGAFLRSRCGSLKSAFYSLDVHSVGQVTSDDFTKGLQKLGYSEDATPLFHALDTSSSGLVSLRHFMQGIGGYAGEAEDGEDHILRTSFSSFGDISSSGHRSQSEDAWKSARIPRLGMRSSHLSHGSSSRDLVSRDDTACSKGSDRSPPFAPPTAANAELQARVALVEEHCTAEQRQRTEMETRLTQHLNHLVGISISEQLDTLRGQLIEERMQRQVDITAVRANLESMRSEIRKADVDVESNLKWEHVAAATAKLSMRVEDLVAQLSARLDKLEVPTESTHCVLPDYSELATQTNGTQKPTLQQDSDIDQGLQRLQKQTETLEENLGTIQKRLEVLESGSTKSTIELLEGQSKALGMAKQAAESSMELMQQCTMINGRLQDAGAGPLCSLPQVETYIREKLDGLRQEWGAVMDKSAADVSDEVNKALPDFISHVKGYVSEQLGAVKATMEEERGLDQTQGLGTAFSEEFERTVMARAVAEARAEACSTTSSTMDTWYKEHFGSEPCSGSLHSAETMYMEQHSQSLLQLQKDVKDLFVLLEAKQEHLAETQNAVVLLRGDTESLRDVLHERVPFKLEEVVARVATLEAAFQRCGPEVMSKKVDQWLVSLDEGVARMSVEVKQQAETLQQVQLRQQVLSTDMLGRVQAIDQKLNSQNIEGLSGMAKDTAYSSDNEGAVAMSPGAGASKRASGMLGMRPKVFQQTPRQRMLSRPLVSRSQDCMRQAPTHPATERMLSQSCREILTMHWGDSTTKCAMPSSLQSTVAGISPNQPHASPMTPSPGVRAWPNQRHASPMTPPHEMTRTAAACHTVQAAAPAVRRSLGGSARVPGQASPSPPSPTFRIRAPALLQPAVAQRAMRPEAASPQRAVHVEAASPKPAVAQRAVHAEAASPRAWYATSQEGGISERNVRPVNALSRR